MLGAGHPVRPPDLVPRPHMARLSQQTDLANGPAAEPMAPTNCMPLNPDGYLVP